MSSAPDPGPACAPPIPLLESVHSIAPWMIGLGLLVMFVSFAVVLAPGLVAASYRPAWWLGGFGAFVALVGGALLLFSGATC